MDVYYVVRVKAIPYPMFKVFFNNVSKKTTPTASQLGTSFIAHAWILQKYPFKLWEREGNGCTTLFI